MSQPVPPPVHPEPTPAQDGTAVPYSPAGQPAPAAPSKVKKIARVAVPLVALGVAGASWFGVGDPEVGDCVTPDGAASFDVVDCGSDEAQFRIVGVEDEKITEAEYDADDTLCTGVTDTGMVLWVGDSYGTDGTVLCAEPV